MEKIKEDEETNLDPSKKVDVSIGTKVTTVNGSSVSIVCKVDGVPSPRVIWLKNGKKVNIEEDDGLTVEETEKASVLTITRAEKEDSGTYTCNATNIFGSTNESSKVNVLGKEMTVLRTY